MAPSQDVARCHAYEVGCVGSVNWRRGVGHLGREIRIFHARGRLHEALNRRLRRDRLPSEIKR
jgi:hypothetical protein